MGLPWAAEVGAFASELAQTLAERPSHGLVLAFGATAADIEVGMVATLAALPPHTDPRWHRLDLHGLDPSMSYGPGALIWVAGFDSVEPDARVEALLALNRARDSIRSVGVRVLLWLPESLREAVFLHAADILAWQDLVITVPQAGRPAELGLPPWGLVRDLAAGWAHAVVGPWLWTPELEAARSLLRRLPWAGIVGVGLGDEQFSDVGVSWKRIGRVGDLSQVLESAVADAVAPVGYHLAADIDWWARTGDRRKPSSRPPVPIIPVGLGHPPEQAVPPEEGWIWVEPMDAQVGEECWPGAAEAEDAALVLTLALGLLALGANRPSPPQWSQQGLPAPASSSPLPPGVLIWGAELRYDRHGFAWDPFESAWAQVVDWFEVERDEALARPIGARLAELERLLGDSPAVRRGLCRAHGLDTWQALPQAAALLARWRGIVLVLSHDRHVEGTLDALGRDYCVVEGGGEMVESCDLMVLRPWTWSARRGRLGRSAEDVERWCDAAPRLWATLAERMGQGTAVVGVRPEDPELLWWTLGSMRPWALHGQVWVFPPETCSEGGPAAGQMLGFHVEGKAGWGYTDHRWKANGLDLVLSILADRMGGPDGAVREVIPAPPFPLPDHHSFDLQWALTRPFTLDRLGEARSWQEPIDALATCHRERWQVPPTVDVWTSLTLFRWIRRAHRAGLRFAWDREDEQLPTDLEFIGLDGGLDRSQWKRLESLAQLSPPGSGQLVIVYLTPSVASKARERGQSNPTEERRIGLMALLAAVAARTDLRLLVVDQSGSPWPLEAQVPSRQVATWSLRWPKAYAEWLAQEHPTLAGLLPWLEERVQARDPLSCLLSSPLFLRSLSENLSDPVDPLGPTWAKAMTEALHRVQRFGLLGAMADPFAMLSARGLMEREFGDEARVEAGDHEIGADLDRAWSPRRVTLPRFHLAVEPVTVRRFRGFIAAGGYLRPDLWSTEGWAWREREQVGGPANFEGVHPGEDEPVVGVSWYEADAFCRWCRRELPTEVRWEVSARRATEPVRSGYAPSIGLRLDCGVWEWCADWHDALYPEVAPRRDPRGPPVGVERTVRGLPAWEGSVVELTHIVRRRHFPPTARRPDLGFRLMRDPELTPVPTDFEDHPRTPAR